MQHRPAALASDPSCPPRHSISLWSSHSISPLPVASHCMCHTTQQEPDRSGKTPGGEDMEIGVCMCPSLRVCMSPCALQGLVPHPPVSCSSPSILVSLFLSLFSCSLFSFPSLSAVSALSLSLFPPPPPSLFLSLFLSRSLARSLVSQAFFGLACVLGAERVRCC
jgi:hypothetical protein